MAIDAKMVAQLRELTGAGMMDAKNALLETDGNLEKAAEELRKKGAAKAAKKSERVTGEGRVHAYLHSNNKLGAMVEVLCETDFVARNEAFIAMCHDLAMHVSAADPLYLSRADVPAEVVEKEKTRHQESDDLKGKPAEVLEKIIEGKLNKWYSEVVLLEQPFIKDEDLTVEDYLKSKIASLGENMKINRFARFHIA
ncbi:elongation factor Ts [Patescibacteria group bacterium]|nr:elongation factor Ts [Patescibacteria group bacterium]MBU1705360.1 elongation factor Ts [Patescibacteria group bacterium]